MEQSKPWHIGSGAQHNGTDMDNKESSGTVMAMPWLMHRSRHADGIVWIDQ